MLKNLFAVLVLMFAITLAVPNTASAYRVENQTALRLSDNVILYAVSFSLGFDKYEMSVPTLALRASTEEVSRTAVQYEIREDTDRTVAYGESAALLLSRAPLENGRYQVARGAAEEFTLLTLYTLPAGEELPGRYDLSLQMTALPFDLIATDGEVIAGGLNQSELQYYVTPEIDETI